MYGLIQEDTRKLGAYDIFCYVKSSGRRDGISVFKTSPGARPFLLSVIINQAIQPLLAFSLRPTSHGSTCTLFFLQLRCADQDLRPATCEPQPAIRNVLPATCNFPLLFLYLALQAHWTSQYVPDSQV